jgi:hypothetical protein
MSEVGGGSSSRSVEGADAPSIRDIAGRHVERVVGAV